MRLRRRPTYVAVLACHVCQCLEMWEPAGERLAQSFVDGASLRHRGHAFSSALVRAS